jgi:hypothetical protein
MKDSCPYEQKSRSVLLLSQLNHKIADPRKKQAGEVQAYSVTELKMSRFIPPYEDVGEILVGGSSTRS